MRIDRRIIVLSTLVLISLTSMSRAEVPATVPSTTAATTDFELIPTVNLVSTNYRHKLVQQLSLAEDNQQTWLKAINLAAPEHREAVAYLLTNMSEMDLQKTSGESLLENVALAYQARGSTPWARAIPQEIFFADVLPFSNVDETRESWRKSYFNQFLPLVKDAKSASEAATILNKKVFPTIKVKYHATKREKPNQSPAESTRIGYASCTGLSIILSDACRAVGVPARLAGTPAWSDNSGNHTWTEVWDRQWYFVGSAEPGPLNQTWFVGNAAKADASKPEYRIYAASFEITPTIFPLVWDEARKDVHAVDVTSYYVARQKLTVTAPKDARIQVRRKGVLIAESAAADGSFELGCGDELTVTSIDSTGKPGQTKTIALEKSAPATLHLE